MAKLLSLVLLILTTNVRAFIVSNILIRNEMNSRLSTLSAIPLYNRPSPRNRLGIFVNANLRVEAPVGKSEMIWNMHSDINGEVQIHETSKGTPVLC